MKALRTVALLAGLVVWGSPALAQTSPPQGVLSPPKPGESKPAPPPTPPKAAPIAPVNRVAPMNEQSALGHSTPGKPPPTVPAAKNTHAEKPTAKPAPAKKPPAKPPAKPAPKQASEAPPAPAAIAATPVAASAAIAVKPPDAHAPEKPANDPTKGSVTGQPLPRWAALRSDVVNLRRGPNQRYPIDWEYHRRDLPVLIEREFEVWRLVVDQDGVRGWVHSATLTGRRSFVVKGADTTLRSRARADADAVALLKAGVVGHIESCAAAAEWCEVAAGGYKGWLPRSAMWGISPGEAVGG